MRLLFIVVFLFSAWYLQAQDSVAINQVYDQFSKAYELLDVDIIRGLYEKDAYYFYPNIPIQRGHESFMGGFKDMFNRARESQTVLNIDFQILERKIIGEYAYDVGYYNLSRSTGQENVGKFVTILKRQKDGSWKFVLDTYSSAPLEAWDKP